MGIGCLVNGCHGKNCTQNNSNHKLYILYEVNGSSKKKTRLDKSQQKFQAHTTQLMVEKKDVQRLMLNRIEPLHM